MVIVGSPCGSEAAAGGGQAGRGGDGSVVVEGGEERLGAVLAAVDAQLEVQVGGAGAAGVAGVGDVLAGDDGVAVVDVEAQVVAVGVAEPVAGFDGDPVAACVAGRRGAGVAAAGLPPVAVPVLGGDDDAVGDGVDGGAFGDREVPRRVVVVRVVEGVAVDGVVGAGSAQRPSAVIGPRGPAAPATQAAGSAVSPAAASLCVVHAEPFRLVLAGGEDVAAHRRDDVHAGRGC